MNVSAKTEITEILSNSKTQGNEVRFIDIVRSALVTFEVIENGSFSVDTRSHSYIVYGFTPSYDEPETVEPITLFKLVDGSFVVSLDNGDEYLLVKGL